MVVREMPRFGIAVNDCLPVTAVPHDVTDNGVFDFLKILTLRFNRDGQPHQSRLRLDVVAVSPIPAGVLHIIEQDELVDKIHQVEITLPGYVVRLHNGDSLAGSYHSLTSGT